VRKLLLGLLLLSLPLLAQQQYVTWDGLVKFLAAFQFVQMTLFSLLYVPVYGAGALVGGIILGLLSAAITYIVAKITLALLR